VGERDFPHPSRPALVLTHPPVKWVPVSLRPERGADHPPLSKCRGHESVELYLYSPSVLQCPDIWGTKYFSVLQIVQLGSRALLVLFRV
jgi:hypothetical protein